MNKGMQADPTTVFTQAGNNNTQVGQVSFVNVILPGPSRSAAGGVMNANLTLSTEYYNLFVIGDESFDGGHFIVPKDRSLTESVTPEIFTEFAYLSDDAVEQIKTFPSLFASENYYSVRTDEDHVAYFGVITDVRIQVNGIKVYFHLISALPQQRLNEIAPNLALGRASMINELGRTHWAIKKVNLLEVLSAAGLTALSPGQIMSRNAPAKRLIRSYKALSAIEKITLNAATFSGEMVVPTLINFFYGNNGTGKSTIARAIAANDGLTWQTGKSADDYSVLVYNQDFVEGNFQSYSNLKGVYTIGEQNIEIQNLVAEKMQQKAELDRQLAEHTAEKDRKRIAKSALLSTFQEDCWNRTKSIREAFDATQVGYKRKAQFAERILQITSPTPHNLDALKALYYTAFDASARAYREFQPVKKSSPGSDLLGKPITSSSDSPFTGFIKAINATDWVRHGHDHFTDAADGRCPYCQQELPGDFESQVAAFTFPETV